MTPFGERVRALRAAKGVTLSAMAAALGVSASYLSALERGKRGRPPWYLVQRAIVFFNIIWDDAEELQRLAEVSDPRVTVDTGGTTPAHTLLANRLARDVHALTEQDARALHDDLVRRLRTRPEGG